MFLEKFAKTGNFAWFDKRFSFKRPLRFFQAALK